MFRSVFILLFVAALASCQKDPHAAKPMPLNLPPHFPVPENHLKNNQLTQEGFELGKRLFYEPMFSRDGKVSCGSCHQQFAAFAHAGHAQSPGVFGRESRRNSIAIQNTLWQTSFFWDGGVHNLGLVPLNAITNENEMDEDVLKVAAKLQRHKHYPALFKAAFGTEEITPLRMMQALAQFMGGMISASAKFDDVLNGKASFTPAENYGKQIFEQKCASCHSGVLFTDQSFRNNGLNETFEKDKGRNEISWLKEDIGKFKVPSLRNVEATPPYMHDGRFQTLEQALEHYNSGVKTSATLDPLLKRNGNIGIPLSANEQQALIAFLKTLTDHKFLKDKKFSE